MKSLVTVDFDIILLPPFPVTPFTYRGCPGGCGGGISGCGCSQSDRRRCSGTTGPPPIFALATGQASPFDVRLWNDALNKDSVERLELLQRHGVRGVVEREHALNWRVQLRIPLQCKVTSGRQL